MTMMAETATTAGILALATGVAASLPLDAGTADAIARWPLTVILGALCCYCVYMMYRQSKDFAKATTESTLVMAKAVNELVAELKQRPCIRDPKND